MKKIIDGKVYDTDVAKVLATWQNRQRRSLRPDWKDHYGSEDLYRTPSGEYFILGYGGRLSRYTPGPTGDKSPDLQRGHPVAGGSWLQAGPSETLPIQAR